MTTDYVKRYVENLSEKNDVTNFSEVFTSVNGVSAVSWELPGFTRRKHGEKKLKDIYRSLTDDGEYIHVFVQLVPAQPDTAIVNYKKTWGLIRNSEVNIDSLSDKKSFIERTSKGLVMTGVSIIPVNVVGVIQSLINSQGKLYFSNISVGCDFDDDDLNADRLTQWVHNIFINEGVVFFLLGSFDENDAEVVAMGSKSALGKIM